MITHQKPVLFKVGKTEEYDLYVSYGDIIGYRHICPWSVKVLWNTKFGLAEKNTVLKNIEPDDLQTELDEMPAYYMIRAYQCANCEEIYSEIVERKDEKRRKKCPGCKKNKLDSYLSSAQGFVRQDATTIGQQADRNTKKMGTYEKEDKNLEQIEAMKKAKTEALKQSGKLPEGTIVPEFEHNPAVAKKRRKLQNMDDKQKHKYLMTGEE
jgi:hypothetical protein